MITRFKIYSTKLNISENRIFENIINYNDKYNFEKEDTYYIMYGDRSAVIEILDRLMWTSNLQRYIISSTMNALKNHDDFEGIFLIFPKQTNNADYVTFKDEKQKNLIINQYVTKLTFKGEFRLENNKIIFDTLKADANKYNL